MVSLSVKHTTQLYNHVVQSHICKERKLPVRNKNQKQIEGKLKLLEEKQKIVISKATGEELDQ